MFAVVPVAVLQDRRLTLTDTRVLCALYSFLSSSRDCRVWPSRAAIGKRCNISSLSRISKALHRLQDYGWIEITKRRTSSVYQLPAPCAAPPKPTKKTGGSSSDSGGSGGSGGSGQGSARSAGQARASGVHLEETQGKETKKTPLPPTGELVVKGKDKEEEYETARETKDNGDRLIQHLNQKTGSQFNPMDFRRFLDIRVNRWGFSVEDLEAVVDLKVSEWKNTTIEKNLKPTVLFKTKARVAEYLQETKRPSKVTSRAAAHRVFTREELKPPQARTEETKQAARAHIGALRAALVPC